MSVKTELHAKSNQSPLFRNIKLSLAAVLILVLYIVFVTLSIPIYIFRVIVIYLAKWFRPDLGSCLDSCSSFFVVELFNTRIPRCTTILPITLSGNLTKEELETVVQRNWIDAVDKEVGELKYPQFQQYACRWLGFPFLKTDTKFNLKNHVFSYNTRTDIIEGENGGIVTENDLNNFVEKLLNTPFKRNRSPWELHLVENYRNDEFPSENGELSVVLMKIHHSLADGFSLLDAIAVGLLEQDMKDLKIPEMRQPKRTIWEKFLFYVTVPFVGACELGFILSHIPRDCPWKVPDSIKTWSHKYAKSELIPIEKIKHVKNVLGVGFTSVLVSGISAGICENLKQKRKKQSLRLEKEDDYMMCMSAIPLPDNSIKKKRLKNNVTAALFKIPICDFSSSVDRLNRCHEILVNSVNSIIPMLTLTYVSTFGWHMGNWGPELGKNLVVSTGITNFPTKPETDKFATIAGKKVVFAEFASGTLVGDAGVGFMVVSYHPYIRIAATAESALLSRNEINELVKSVVEEIDVLYSIANAIKPFND